MARSKAKLLPRLRITQGDEVALGPGKAELLALVARTGSIREAAERMNMSYMRAWKLIQTMNACFREPLVASERGGNSHGGATLTATGKKVLDLYHEMEEDVRKRDEEKLERASASACMTKAIFRAEHAIYLTEYNGHGFLSRCPGNCKSAKALR